VENFFIMHVKPSKLLEKSKSLELNPRKKVLLERRCSLVSKKNCVLESIFFFGFWPNFFGLLGATSQMNFLQPYSGGELAVRYFFLA
jgi:hypothetical protein